MHLGSTKDSHFFLKDVILKRVKEVTNLERQFRDEFVSYNQKYTFLQDSYIYIFILFSDMVLMYIFLLFSRYVELVLC